MRIKSTCLVCRGEGVRLGQPCLGCKGFKYVFVNFVPTPRPATALDLDPDPVKNRKALNVRAKSPGLYDRIVLVVKNYQSAYFQSMDVMDLRPMRLKDIAELASCDTVTVHLYLAYTEINGVKARSLFSSGVSGVSRKVVMKMIHDFVTLQPESSDNFVRQHLLTKGISISRRTVTKYRKQAAIPSAAKRKQNETHV